MSYRLLPQAERDVEGIADHIAERNPRAAERMIETLHQRWALLAAIPLSGQARPEISAEAPASAAMIVVRPSRLWLRQSTSG